MPPKNPSLIVGLAAPGLLWLATSVVFGQDLPPSPPGPATPAPTPASPGSKAYRALLLSNGKVVRGEIVEDAAVGMYRLRQRGGSISYPKFKVQVAGESVEDLYRYQVARLPEGDPDERMKLARWCLTEHLSAQAREQLEVVQAMCPDDAEAKGMLYNLAATADRPQIDPELRQTSADMPVGGDAPASLDPRVITRAQRRFNALPEIFDLPPAQAVKRSSEFAEYVQPVLQMACARCHDEKYPGGFQLVAVRTRRDLTNADVARANLDATLKLVNPDDPARSDLLSAGLVPHGGSKNAIFRGPNDKNYQVLATWAKSLRPSTRTANTSPGSSRAPTDRVARTGFAPSAEANDTPGFASDRSARMSAPGSLSPMPESATPLPPPRAMVDRFEESAEFVRSPADRPEFEVPYAAGGKPVLKAAPPKAKAPATAKGAAGVASKPPAPSTRTATPAGPGAVVVSTDDPNELPGMDQPRYPPKAEKDGETSGKPKAKIDPALFEKMLKARNGGNP